MLDSYANALVEYLLPEGFIPSRDPFVLGTQIGFFLVLGRAPASGDTDPDGLLEVLELVRTQFLVDLYEAMTGPLVPASDLVV